MVKELYRKMSLALSPLVLSVGNFMSAMIMSHYGEFILGCYNSIN